MESERDAFKHVWQEAENLITIIDPQFKELGGTIKKPDNASAEDIVTLLKFLRVEIRAMLLNNESLTREKEGLYRFIQSNGIDEEGLKGDKS